ncbi:MAG: methyltransferase domain-containing protein [Beijerinckiaceae bacterium]|nr:methyltransferase domain-containing protein [Beijerinckiaceae bacterium]
MSEPLALFDRNLIRRRLRRAERIGFADFLILRAADDLGERLAAITRAFPVALDLGTATAAAARLLAQRPGTTLVVRAAPTQAGGPHELVADEERLPFAEASLHLVTSLLALQSVNDLPGALVQIRRALKPDGLFIGCLFGGATLTELRQSLAEAESELEGGLSPRVSPFADVRDAGSLLQRAGFALPVTDVEPVTVRYAHPLGLLQDLRAMGLTNALVARRRQPLRRATLMRAMAIYAERFSDPDGKVRASFEMIWLSGWARHDSQQRPLKPGSAKARLADALRTIEASAGEKAG